MERREKPTSSNDDNLLNTAIPINQTEADEADDLLKSAIPINDVEQQADQKSGALDAIELSDDNETIERKIQAIGQSQRHESKWNRTPNTTGKGAIHVKTFVSKLRLDAIEHLDQTINEWLDANPQYEVKLVTSGVGELTGKTKEAAIVLNVWV